MRLIHTSDWHLGQSFFNKTRKDEHAQFLDWLLHQVTEQQVDAILVAGDVFDSNTPPSYAREMYHQFVVQLHELGCGLIILGGNHDSVSMLNESKPILACLNVQVIAKATEVHSDHTIPVYDRQGQVGAIVCAIPFIRPRDVLHSQSGASGLDRSKALSDGISNYYHTLFQQAHEWREKEGWSVPIIMTGHLTALGVSQSDSVRDIYIGTLEGFAADGFPPADYIALGHIHRPQLVAKSEHIRYSGSPIPLSFDEVKTQKQVVIVDCDAQGKVTPQPLSIPNFQPMAVVRGDLNEIEAQLQALHDPDQVLPTWVCVDIKEQGYLSDLNDVVHKITDELNVDILQVRRIREMANASLSSEEKESLAELTPEDVFERRLALESFDSDLEQARRARIVSEFQLVVTHLSESEEEE